MPRSPDLSLEPSPGGPCGRRPATQARAVSEAAPASDRKRAQRPTAPRTRCPSDLEKQAKTASGKRSPLRRPVVKPLEGRSGRAPDGPTPMTGSEPPALPDGEHPGGAPLPAKLEPLVETARAYARAATSKNTNRAYAADWRDYLRWRARQGLDLRPLADPECVGLYLAALASGAKGAGGRPGPSPRSSGGSRRSSGISPRGPCPSTARTAMSRPCSPASGAPMAGRPSRRRRCCRSMSWPCSTSSPRRAHGTCATGRSSSSASPAACAARRSPASS